MILKLRFLLQIFNPIICCQKSELNHIIEKVNFHFFNYKFNHRRSQVSLVKKLFNNVIWLFLYFFMTEILIVSLNNIVFKIRVLFFLKRYHIKRCLCKTFFLLINYTIMFEVLRVLLYLKDIKKLKENIQYLSKSLYFIKVDFYFLLFQF